MTTLNAPLADPAPQGALQAASLISSAGLDGTLEECRGCTFLVPVDSAFASVQPWLDTLNGTAKEALIRSHVRPPFYPCRRWVKYSTHLSDR